MIYTFPLLIRSDLANRVPLAQQDLSLPKLADDLLGRECPSSHRIAPFLNQSKSNILPGSVFGGQVSHL